MIEVLQKVTTFPLELINIPEMKKLYNKDDIHSYYSNLITKRDNSYIGTVSEDELTKIATYTTKYNLDVEEAKKKK